MPTRQQLDTIMVKIPELYPRYGHRAVFSLRFLAFSGMRLSEMRNVIWSDIADGKIKVRGGEEGLKSRADGFAHGGWCPKGRKSLDGPISAKYLLIETPSESYLQRTEWNVRGNDGTVVFTLPGCSFLAPTTAPSNTLRRIPEDRDLPASPSERAICLRDRLTVGPEPHGKPPPIGDPHGAELPHEAAMSLPTVKRCPRQPAR